MKVFWFSISLLLLLIVIIGVNCVYINNVANRLKNDVEALSSVDCQKEAEALLEYWEKEEDWVGLSVGYTVVDRIKEQILLLRNAAMRGDEQGFSAARTLLLDAVEDMRRLEQFSLGSLL